MKSILITGASGDIASALIAQLDKTKYKIIGLDINSNFNSNVEHYECDLSMEQEIMTVLKSLEIECLEEIEAVVHLAGVYPNVPIENYSTIVWDKVQNTNVRSLYLIIRHIIALKKSALKNIIITSSTAATSGSKDPGYTASKAALIGLAKSFSISLSDRGVRVNTVLPGIIDTSMSQRQSDERRKFHENRTLAKYIGSPEEVANIISFLLDEKSSYLWGTSIHVNGGMTI